MVPNTTRWNGYSRQRAAETFQIFATTVDSSTRTRYSDWQFCPVSALFTKVGRSGHEETRQQTSGRVAAKAFHRLTQSVITYKRRRRAGTMDVQLRSRSASRPERVA